MSVEPRLPTKKQFREYLNALYQAPTHRHGKFHQRTRAYGDYLYKQDRARFEVDYAEFCKKPLAGKSV